MKLIVGLGNPGKEYTGTRHNLGFEALDHLAQKLETSFKTDKKFQAEIAEAHVGSEKVLLAKPTTFMNLSGDAVQALKSFYKLENADILVLHDEMDYEPGKVAFSIGAGTGGNNGVASIQERLATKDIARIRLGIGRPTVEAAEDYVLGRPSKEHRTSIDKTIETASDMSLAWVKEGLTKAMNVWNAVKSA